MISRRGFMWRLGASALAAQLGTIRRAHGGSRAPLRLVLWPSLNGAEAQHFWPNAGNLSAMSLVTDPIRAYQSQLTFVQGLNIAGSDNHMAVRSIFTGAPIADYGSPDPTVKSLDQVVRDHLQRTTPRALPSLHLGVRPADSIDFYKLYGRSTFFFAPSAVDYEANPVKAFDRVFGRLGVGTTAQTPKGLGDAELRNAVLAIHDAELASISSRLTGAPIEQARLVIHRNALERLRQVVDAGPVVTPLSCDGSPLASVEKLRPSLANNDAAAYQDAKFSDVFDAQIDIMARALVCGLTQVATLQAGSADGNVIVPIDGGYPHHNTSHGDQRTFARCQAWYAGKFLRLLKALDVPDPLDANGKTVLFNSCIVWLSECLPSSHSSMGVPCMLAGNAGGKLGAGKLVNVSGATNKHLLKALSDLFGVSDADSSHFGADKLTEVLA